MTKKLVYIAEKPTVSKCIADYYDSKYQNVNHAYDSELKVTTLRMDDTEVCIIPLAGHILSLKDMKQYDEGKDLTWRNVVVSKSPFIPNKFQLLPRPNNSYERVSNFTNKLLNRIAELTRDADEIINVGDPDEEGQLLVDEVFEFLSEHRSYQFNDGVPIYRIFLRSLDPNGVDRAVKKRILNSKVINQSHAAKGRSIADWIWGINLTILATELFGHRFTIKTPEGERRSVLSVGRVQTPILNMIYNREQEIQNFREKIFYNITADMNKAGSANFSGDLNLKQPTLLDELQTSGAMDLEGRLLNQQKASELMGKFRVGAEYQVKHAETSNSKEFAPLPLSIEELQSRMSKRERMSAMETLDVAQSLYMKKIISYPRNNGARYLPVELQNDVVDTLNAIQSLQEPKISSAFELVDNTNMRSKAWNDDKVESHYAIIPTPVITPSLYESLSSSEKKVYLEVVQFYMYMFMPPAEKRSVKATVRHDSDERLELNVSESTYIKLGYREAFDEYRKDQAVDLPALTTGDMVTIQNIKTREGKTRPPSLFNSGSLIEAMINAHLYVEDKSLADRLRGKTSHEITDNDNDVMSGIGTSATRANIIETLKKRGYIEVDKKEQYTTTEKGRTLLQHMPTFIKIPDNTARWQMELDDVRLGKRTLEDFLIQQSNELREVFKSSVEDLGQFLLNNSRQNEVRTPNAKSCPKCEESMTKIEFDNVNGHVVEYKCDNCQTVEQEHDGQFYIKRINVNTKQTCPNCNKGTLLFSEGFSEKANKPYKFLRCNNETCNKFFSTDDSMKIVQKVGGTPTNYKCTCGNILHEIKTEKDGKPIHFFACSDVNHKQNYSVNSKGEPIYPEYANEPCPICKGKLLRRTGVSEKTGKNYDAFHCTTKTCGKWYSRDTVSGKPVFNFSSEKCPKCNSMLEFVTIPYKDKTTGEPKTFKKLSCVNSECKADFNIDSHNKLINPYERRLIEKTQTYMQLLLGSSCPNCKKEVGYYEPAAGSGKQPYYKCSNYKSCGIFLNKNGDKFEMQQPKK